MKMRCNLFLLLFLSGVLAPLSAQDPEPSPEPPPPPPVNLHFSIYVWPTTGILTEGSDVPGVPRVFYDSPEGLRNVPLARNSASALMPWNGPFPLELFDVERIVHPPPEGAAPGTEPSVELKKIPVIRSTFPADWTQVLLVVFPNERQPDGTLLVLPMKYDQQSVRPGYVRIYNSTDRPLLVEIGEQNYPLPAFAPLDYKPSDVAKQPISRINFYGRDLQGNARLLYTSQISARESSSNFYFLYARDSRRLRLLRVGGHEPPPTPTPVPSPTPRLRR